MRRNIKLKKKIIDTGKTQRLVSREAGISESSLSWHISGRYNFTRVEQERIAEVLHCDSAEIFSA